MTGRLKFLLIDKSLYVACLREELVGNLGWLEWGRKHSLTCWMPWIGQFTGCTSQPHKTTKFNETDRFNKKAEDSYIDLVQEMLTSRRGGFKESGAGGLDLKQWRAFKIEKGEGIPQKEGLETGELYQRIMHQTQDQEYKEGKIVKGWAAMLSWWCYSNLQMLKLLC